MGNGSINSLADNSVFFSLTRGALEKKIDFKTLKNKQKTVLSHLHMIHTMWSDVFICLARRRLLDAP